MKAETLKKAILQYAMEGKLVAQDPNDEPASELLKRIKAEKEQLIKDGNLKKEKPLPPITEEEVPYELPQGWEWVRLGEIGISNIGLTYKPTDITLSQSGIPVLRSSNIQNNKIDLNDLVRVTTEIKNENLYVQAGDILICARNGSKQLVGKSAIIRDLNEPMTFGAFMAIFRSSINNWVKVYLDSPLFKKTLESVNTVTINQITQNNLKNAIIPLPPQEEQKRIVEKLEEILPLVDEYGKNEEKLSKLNETLPKKIRQSILQHAVQGKLVPQNPNDEPASELLKRIKAEKEQLIKDGKLKKEKPLPPITEEEIPYELPQGWEWVKLGEIINLTSGQDLESKHYNSSHNGIPYITGASNIENDKIIINRWTEYPKSKAYKGNLLITCKGTIGTMALLQESIAHIARQIMAIATYDNVYINFTKIVLETYVESLKQNAKSMIPGISRDMILNIIFPLPPLEEQKRIVAKVDELMQIIEILK